MLAKTSPQGRTTVRREIVYAFAWESDAEYQRFHDDAVRCRELTSVMKRVAHVLRAPIRIEPYVAL